MPGLTEATIDTVARTVWGEARSDGLRGMQAVAMVIRNRANDQRWPADYAEVCLQEWQFSCWNPTDPNREKCVHVSWADEVFRQAYSIACQVLIPIGYGRVIQDPTHGANHYCTTQLVDNDPPSWSDLRKISAKIGDHVFFQL